MRDINTESSVVGEDDREIQAGDRIIAIMIRYGEMHKRRCIILHAVVVASVLLLRATSARNLNIKSLHCQKPCSAAMYYVCSEESM